MFNAIIRTTGLLLLLSCLMLTFGCGKGENGKTTNETPSENGSEEINRAPKQETGAKGFDPASGTVTVKGVITFDGKPPRRREVAMGGDPKCKTMHTETPLDESAIVNDDGTLRNVFVWVKKGLKGIKFTPPKEAVVLNQKGCTYTPHVQGIQVGQTLTIRNSDDLLHNVHSFSKKNPSFNISQPSAGDEENKKFKFQEIMVKIKCDVHGWMTTYLGVSKHPFFAVTGDGGRFSLPKLPPGEYMIEAIHEKFGSQTETITVKDGETKQVNFTFKK